jgi:hypothetical protein
LFSQKERDGKIAVIGAGLMAQQDMVCPCRHLVKLWDNDAGAVPGLA